MIISELKVRKGEPVREAWERLVRWVESLKIVPSDEIEIRTTPHGTIVRVRDSHFFRHPFRVAASGDEVRISSGLINDEVPVMRDKSGLRKIDNRDAKGKRDERPEPVLKLDLKKATPDGRIYISVKVERPPEDKTKKGLPPEIVQTEEAKGPKDGLGYYPLALIYLTEDRKGVEQVFQVAHHNLRFSFQERRPSDEEVKKDPTLKPVGRFLFYPV